MRYWSSRLLEEELASGKITSWEKTKYLLLPLLITALAGGPFYLASPRYGDIPPANAATMLIGGILASLVTYFGIKKSYNINRSIDENDFIERFTILSFPVFIRFAVIIGPVSIILLSVFRPPFFIIRIIGPFVYLYYFTWVWRSFLRFGEIKSKFQQRVDPTWTTPVESGNQQGTAAEL